jgi:signal transduction histidine kinase/ActR/RegA family two-component response regulator
MMRKISKYLFSSPDEVGFDNYLINIICFLIILFGFVGTVINFLLGFSVQLIASTAIITAVFLPLYLYTKIKRRYGISKYFIIISTLIILNFQWFQNYGSYGPVSFLFVVLETFILILLKKKQKIIFTIILIVNITFLFVIEYYSPLLIGKYPDEFSRILDLYSGLIIFICVSIFFLNTAIKYYNREQEKAKLADKFKSTFLANMSHEIRTPMNGILGFAGLLKNPDLNGDERQNYIGIIEKSGARMLNIINDIVDISKIEAGVMKLDIRESNINEQIEYIYTFFKPEVESKGMKLTYINSLSAKEATIRTDREKLYAILTNLVKNAIKFTNAGSIEFGYNHVGSQNQIKELKFYVKDTGIGISRNRHKAVFDRFFQDDIADQEVRQGAGLGLSITKAYVEMLGGKIWLDSKEGIGSTFYFTIPYIKENEIVFTDRVSKENFIKAEGSGLKILIAEDDETSEALLKVMVKMFSKEILMARSGNEAVKLCRDNPDIDLILMDIQMPEVNGYEATRQIREFNKDVVIVAQTAYGLSGDKEKAVKAGCNDYISKPIDKEDLFELIQKYFGKNA